MIYVTGDTHAEWIHRLCKEVFPEQSEMTKDDFVIILGDFGIWDNSKKQKWELDWLDEKPFTTLFIDGNHENYDILDSLPVTEWCGGKVHMVRPSVLHLMRGQVFDIQGKVFFTFGGAASHDIQDGILDPEAPDFRKRIKKLKAQGKYMYRVNHVSWWERELPSQDEMAEGLRNLKARRNKVDYILTHCPPTELLMQIGGDDRSFAPDRLTDYLEEIRKTVSFRTWLFGHMHLNLPFPYYGCICLYEQIARML